MPATPTGPRAPAEQARAAELAAPARLDDRQRPPGWSLSPWAVVQFVIGGRLSDGTEIVPKYIGDRRLVEVAVATLATDRALLLLCVPGTAKSWLSEHLVAAISCGGPGSVSAYGTASTAVTSDGQRATSANRVAARRNFPCLHHTRVTRTATTTIHPDTASPTNDGKVI